MNKSTYTDSVTEVTVKDSFWSPIMETTRKQMIPYQWKALNDEIPDIEPSHCIQNFRIAAGLEKGEFRERYFRTVMLPNGLRQLPIL